MSLAKLSNLKAKRVLGVDASTNTIAFCVISNSKVLKYGEVVFEGTNIYERILDAKRKMAALSKEKFFDVDFMAIEAAVSVKSVHTGIKMAYVFGAIMGEILSDKIQVVEVHPITWQSYIGNKNFTKTQKEEICNKYPGKSKSWYASKIREIRKNKTLDFAKERGVKTESDNVADAFGIAYYAYKNLVDSR